MALVAWEVQRLRLLLALVWGWVGGRGRELCGRGVGWGWGGESGDVGWYYGGDGGMGVRLKERMGFVESCSLLFL